MSQVVHVVSGGDSGEGCFRLIAHTILMVILSGTFRSANAAVVIPVDIDQSDVFLPTPWVDDYKFRLSTPLDLFLPLDGHAVDYIFRFNDSKHVEITGEIFAPEFVMPFFTSIYFQTSGGELVFTDDFNNDIVALTGLQFGTQNFENDIAVMLLEGQIELDGPVTFRGIRVKVTLPSYIIQPVSAFLEVASHDAILVGQSEPPISADFDGDGYVDGSDFLMWQRGEVSNPPNAVDLALWQEQYGTTNIFSAATSIPEPRSLLLGAMAAVRLLVRRRSLN